MVNLRVVVAMAIPTLSALLGFLWFRRKKKNLTIEDKSSVELRENEELSVRASIPEVSTGLETSSVKPIQKREVTEVENSPLCSAESDPNSDGILPSFVGETAVKSSNAAATDESAVIGTSPDVKDKSVAGKLARTGNKLLPGEQKSTADETLTSSGNKSADDGISPGGDAHSAELVPTEPGKREEAVDCNGLTNGVEEMVAEPSLEEKIEELITPATEVSPAKPERLSPVIKPLENGHISPIEECLISSEISNGTCAMPPSQTVSSEEGKVNGDAVVIPSDKNSHDKSNQSHSGASEQDNISTRTEKPVPGPQKQSHIEANNNDSVISKELSSSQLKSVIGNQSRSLEKSREGSLDSNECTSDLSANGSTGSSACDSHSEVSSDSGKGTSLSETPLAASPASLPEVQVYEFAIPTNYCGLLIGRNGRNVQQLKQKSGADIRLAQVPFTKDMQICVVTGTSQQVAAALECIKRRLPDKQFPGIMYEQLNVPVDMNAPATSVLAPQIMQMSLPEGVSVDVIVSSVVDVNHLFVQQPTHPTFSSLDRLTYCMNQIYTQEGAAVPELPRPIEVGVICAAPMFNGWFRAQVVAALEETDEVDVKFVDYGGYLRLPCSTLRQIRSDFTTLPFQAVECYLANVIPPKDAESFSPEALAYMEQLVHGKMLQAQILTHEEDGVPYVQLYELCSDLQPLFINRDVVDQGLAQWFEMS